MTDRDMGKKYTIVEKVYGLTKVVFRVGMRVSCPGCILNRNGCMEANPLVPRLRRIELDDVNVLAVMDRDSTHCGILTGLRDDGFLDMIVRDPLA